jgi:hypothetical protein
VSTGTLQKVAGGSGGGGINIGGTQIGGGALVVAALAGLVLLRSRGED